MQRYQAAYPIATEITSSLGLRGFRLNLAVEGAQSFDDLAALAPKIRELVGTKNTGAWSGRCSADRPRAVSRSCRSAVASRQECPDQGCTSTRP